MHIQLRGPCAALLLSLTALASATAHAEKLACEAASFAKLGLPATRIVSAKSVSDDKRAGPHCVLRARRQRAHGHRRQTVRDRLRDAAADSWNGGYFDQVNGGNDGAVVPAYGGLPGGNPRQRALARLCRA